MVVSRQAGDFVSTQTGVRIHRSAFLDQGNLGEWVVSVSVPRPAVFPLDVPGRGRYVLRNS